MSLVSYRIDCPAPPKLCILQARFSLRSQVGSSKGGDTCSRATVPGSVRNPFRSPSCHPPLPSLLISGGWIWVADKASRNRSPDRHAGSGSIRLDAADRNSLSSVCGLHAGWCRQSVFRSGPEMQQLCSYYMLSQIVMTWNVWFLICFISVQKIKTQEFCSLECC